MKQRPDDRPAAAPAATDAESGAEPDDIAADLRALDAMLARGLIDRATYEARRRTLGAQDDESSAARR